MPAPSGRKERVFGCIGLSLIGTLFLSVVVFLSIRLATPHGLDGIGFTDSGRAAKDKAGVARIFITMFGLFALILYGAALGVLRGGNAEAKEDDSPSIPILPSHALKRRGGRLGPLPVPYASPEICRRWGLGCFASTLAVTGLVASLPFWWPLDPLVLAFLGMFALVGWLGSVPLLRGYLASRRVTLQVLPFRRRVLAGTPIVVEAILETRRPVRLHGVKLVLACIRSETTRVRGRQRNSLGVPYATEELLHGRGDLPAGTRLSLRGQITVPAAGETTHSSNYDTKVCWLLGVVVELRGWPDLEVAHEVRVENFW